MRINVYAEELLNEVEWIKKDVDDECVKIADHDGCGGTGKVENYNMNNGLMPCPRCGGTGRVNHRTFYGIRMYLASPPELHHSPEDDDRSAITFWIPWTRKGGHNFNTVREILNALSRNLDRAVNDSERAS